MSPASGMGPSDHHDIYAEPPIPPQAVNQPTLSNGYLGPGQCTDWAKDSDDLKQVTSVSSLSSNMRKDGWMS